MSVNNLCYRCTDCWSAKQSTVSNDTSQTNTEENNGGFAELGRKSRKLYQMFIKNPQWLPQEYSRDTSDLKNAHWLILEKECLPIYFFYRLEAKWCVYRISNTTQLGHNNYENIYSKNLKILHAIHETVKSLLSWHCLSGMSSNNGKKILKMN